MPKSSKTMPFTEDGKLLIIFLNSVMPALSKIRLIKRKPAQGISSNVNKCSNPTVKSFNGKRKVRLSFPFNLFTNSRLGAINKILFL